MTSRRSFLLQSSAALAAAYARPMLSQAAPAAIVRDGDLIRVSAESYIFECDAKNTRVRLLALDGKRVITTFQLHPSVEVVPVGSASSPTPTVAEVQAPVISGNRLTLRWNKVYGNGSVSMTLRFDRNAFWIEPITFSHRDPLDIDSFTLFDQGSGPMRSSHFVFPGIAENESVSPVQDVRIRLHQRIALGHSSLHKRSEIHQQWGLPVHYFLGMNAAVFERKTRDRWLNGHRSPFFCCGFADMPAADPVIDLLAGNASLRFDYASSLWHHLRTPGQIELGCTLCFAFGDDSLTAVSNYYSELLRAGIIRRKQNSAAKTAIALSPQYCTWGTQVVRDKATSSLTQKFLEDVYGEMKSSGLKAKTFSIDDKWEGVYGSLIHDADKFPTFPTFLDRVRAEGHHIGIWTAFMRCQTPSALGLREDHMLRASDGKPFHLGSNPGYFIMDTTQPEVATVLAERARSFMRTYKPALVKIDFGYELPSMREGAPKDMRYAGERLFMQALDVVLPALREVDPDVVVMYYHLSPLFTKYFDLHAPDDLYTNSGDYDLEANRRFFLASPLLELGIPIYGSSGYDWESDPSIWFDSAAVGTVGSLNDLKRDELGEGAAPERVAIYNGIVHILRPGNFAKIVPYPLPRAEAAVRGLHAKSWARLEDGKLMLLAHRPLSVASGERPDLYTGVSSAMMGPADANAARFGKIISSNTAVVVSSLSEKDVQSSSKLGIVALGDGEMTLARTSGRTATITTHLFGGSISKRTVPLADGKLKLLFKTKVEDKIVEWHQVEVH